MLYDTGREAFLGTGNWIGDDFKIVLVVTTPGIGYQFNASHTELNDIPTEAIIGHSASLEYKTIYKGVAGAGPVTFNYPMALMQIGAFIVYRVSDAKLIYYGDNTVASGLPMVSGTATITASFPNGIFKL